MSEERKAISLIKTKDKETAVDNKNARIKYPIYDHEVSKCELKEDKMPVDFKFETPVNSKQVKYNESSLRSYYKHHNEREMLLKTIENHLVNLFCVSTLCQWLALHYY